MTAVGAIACAKLLVATPIVRNIIDMDSVIRSEINTKKENGPASRRKFVMKYSGILNVNVLSSL